VELETGRALTPKHARERRVAWRSGRRGACSAGVLEGWTTDAPDPPGGLHHSGQDILPSRRLRCGWSWGFGFSAFLCGIQTGRPSWRASESRRESELGRLEAERWPPPSLGGASTHCEDVGGVSRSFGRPSLPTDRARARGAVLSTPSSRRRAARGGDLQQATTSPGWTRNAEARVEPEGAPRVRLRRRGRGGHERGCRTRRCPSVGSAVYFRRLTRRGFACRALLRGGRSGDDPTGGGTAPRTFPSSAARATRDGSLLERTLHYSGARRRGARAGAASRLERTEQHWSSDGLAPAFGVVSRRTAQGRFSDAISPAGERLGDFSGRSAPGWALVGLFVGGPRTRARRQYGTGRPGANRSLAELAFVPVASGRADGFSGAPDEDRS